MHLLLLLPAFLVSACSLVAPQYTPSLPNMQVLKDAGDTRAKVGTVTAAGKEANDQRIGVRGSSMSSPYGGSYAAYLAEALKQDLTLAGRFAPDAQVEVSGTLNKNDIDATGFSVGQGQIEARFVVKRLGEVRYDAVKSATTTWESSFAGNIAIPNAHAQYPVLVQKLLAALYADPQFLDALK